MYYVGYVETTHTFAGGDYGYYIFANSKNVKLYPYKYCSSLEGPPDVQDVVDASDNNSMIIMKISDLKLYATKKMNIFHRDTSDHGFFDDPYTHDIISDDILAELSAAKII